MKADIKNESVLSKLSLPPSLSPSPSSLLTCKWLEPSNLHMWSLLPLSVLQNWGGRKGRREGRRGGGKEGMRRCFIERKMGRGWGKQVAREGGRKMEGGREDGKEGRREGGKEGGKEVSPEWLIHRTRGLYYCRRGRQRREDT